MAFKKGSSGNAKGRPPGKTLAGRLRQAVDRDFDAIVSGVIEAAKGGDMSAASLLLNRVAPTLRPVQEAVHITLEGASLTERANAVMDATGRGELGPDVAKQLLDGLAAVARITEVQELKERVELLERSLKANQGKPR